MRFRPIKQFNAILTQEYFEPTISWSFRVVLALNVPLIVLPLWKGFSFEVIWAAFGAYMISLTEYRGLHYRKVLIQALEALLIFLSALLGIHVAGSLLYSLIAMFFVGMFAALIRNWSDYGSGIGVAVGFFFLFGLSYPLPFEESLVCGGYLLMGAAWAILITIFSFPLRPSNPVKRSVARIWKANTELLDALVAQVSGKEINFMEITKKEVEVRTLINHSIDLFARREQKKRGGKVQHYDLLIDLRRSAALFSAAVSSMFEELEPVHRAVSSDIKDTAFYKMFSALAQASARLSILIYTSRREDLTLAKVRVKRAGVALQVFKESARDIRLENRQVLPHFIAAMESAVAQMEYSIQLAEQKLGLKKSDYFDTYKLSFNNFVAGVDSWVFTDLMKNLLIFNSNQFKYALRVSLGLCLGVFVFLFFKIDHGYWIPLTMIIVIQPYYGATRKKGTERTLGTLAGVLLGGLIMLLPLPHEAFVVLLVIVSFFVAYFLRNNYKIGVFFVTVMMVILMQISQRGSIELIGWRVLSTLIGALLALVAGYAFWPVWEKQRFPALMKEALSQTGQYMARVIRLLQGELAPGESWYANRRLTEAANSQVFASVQRMNEEPKHLQQGVDASYAVLGVNIRMARELTSMALWCDEKKVSLPPGTLDAFHKAFREGLDHVTRFFSEEGGPLPDFGFTAMKESLGDLQTDNNEDLQFLKFELEKLIFEMETLLKIMHAARTTRASQGTAPENPL
jgi:uncharacterized membrane protein YccC